MSDNSGAIVMNCNPFTYGHLYLIETAARKVEQLFILVVEEDKSYFPFKDRFEMVKNGTKHLSNVTVLPSGKYIISSLTMPEYFDKDNIQNQSIDASNDIYIFASYIAPALKVSKRFVGEEPFCKITLQYNQQMMKILPSRGIEFIIIPRTTINERAISATDVRKCILDKNYNKLKTLVPDSTFEHLIKMNLINPDVIV
jgi:[citrate (pro-3S)-lyase] ligase